MASLKIYLAGPISGQSYEDVVDYYRIASMYFNDIGYTVFHPMTGKGHLRTELKFKAEGYGDPIASNHAILRRDKWMVRQADIILANLLPANGTVSIGTITEMAWANLLGKHVIVVMEDGNIHQHAFVKELADIIFSTYKEAEQYLGNLITSRI